MMTITQLPTGLSSGLTVVDELLGKLQPADVIALAGRPNSGKSTLVTNIAENVAFKNKAVAVFSLDASVEKWASRPLYQPAHEGQTLPVGVADRLMKNILIDDTLALTARDICARARRLKLNADIKLIVIDYLQLLEAGSDIPHAPCVLKALAEELAIPIILVSQLKRSLELREDKRPQPVDFADELQGSLVVNASVVLFLYRDEIYNAESAHRGTTEIIVGKDRTGMASRQHAALKFSGKNSLLTRAGVPDRIRARAHVVH